mgnify:CR=1 FL=1
MTETPEALRVERVGAEHAEALAALFERVDCPCYCRYWDFPGDARQWQDRCANARGVNRTELLEALATANAAGEGLLGLVALAADGSCVGGAVTTRLLTPLECMPGDCLKVSVATT